MELNKIHCIDALKGLKQLPDESINCCISSPPYWCLRRYFSGVKFSKNLTEKEKQKIVQELKQRGIEPKEI